MVQGKALECKELGLSDNYAISFPADTDINHLYFNALVSLPINKGKNYTSHDHLTFTVREDEITYKNRP